MRERGPDATLQSRVLESGDDLATLLQSSPDAVIVVDRDGIILLASAAVETVFGFRPSEIVGSSVETLVPDQVRAGHERHRKSFMEFGTPRPMGIGLDLAGRRRDGSVFPIDVSLAPFSSQGRPVVGAFVRDATARHRQEASLRAINEITQRLLGGERTQATLELVARRARVLPTPCSAGW